MDRRAFLRGGAGVAVSAGVGAGAAGAWTRHRDVAEFEEHSYAGTDRGDSHVWWSSPTSEKVIAVTFDDGPDPELTPKVLDVLARHRVPATFFMVGHTVEAHPDIARRVVAAGHEVGGHTYSHPHLVSQSRDEMRTQVERGLQAVARASGRRPRWFRPPFGRIDGTVLRACAAARVDVVLWSVSRGPGSVDGPDQVRRHLTGALAPGAIVCLHDRAGSGTKADLVARRREEIAALPGWLDDARAAGYRFVTVSGLLVPPQGRPRGA